jgi:hypothetical protein
MSLLMSVPRQMQMPLTGDYDEKDRHKITNGVNGVVS